LKNDGSTTFTRESVPSAANSTRWVIIPRQPSAIPTPDRGGPSAPCPAAEAPFGPAFDPPFDPPFDAESGTPSGSGAATRSGRQDAASRSTSETISRTDAANSSARTWNRPSTSPPFAVTGVNRPRSVNGWSARASTPSPLARAT